MLSVCLFVGLSCHVCLVCGPFLHVEGEKIAKRLFDTIRAEKVDVRAAYGAKTDVNWDTLC